MKKTIVVLMVLCIAASLFATGSIKAGGAFEFVSGTTVTLKTESGSELRTSARNYKANGFGFNISGQFDLKSNMFVWADFTMIFNSDLTHKRTKDTEWRSFKEGSSDASMVINTISSAAGVAYKLPLSNAPVNIAVGCGVFFERVYASRTRKITESTTSVFSFNFIHIGLSSYADITYKVTDTIGVGLTVMPRIGLYDFDVNNTNIRKLSSNGFAFSFGMPVTLGVSYAF